MKIKLDDIVSFELTDYECATFSKFMEEHKEYESQIEAWHDAYVKLPFSIAMYYLSEYLFNKLIYEDFMRKDDEIFNLTCNATCNFTDAGKELFGMDSMTSKLKNIFDYLHLSSNPKEWSNLIDGDIEINEKSYHTVNNYVIEKSGKKIFCLEYEDMRLTLSEPQVTPFNTYKFNSMKEAMYFYYTVGIEKNENYRFAPEQWIPFYSKDVYEFGVIENLIQFIDSVLSIDINKEGTKDKHLLMFYDKLAGFINEDNFELFRYKNTNNGDEWYDFGCLLGDTQISFNLAGIRFMNLNKYDLDIIKEWAEEFLKYTEDITRNQIDQLLDDDRNNKEIINDKLYIYSDKKKDIIKTIVLVGDKCEIRMLESEYPKTIIIKEFKKNGLITDKGIEYKLEDLLDIWYQPTDEMLAYDKEECKKEIEKRLIDVISEPEEKIINAAIDTCWLCRKEHGFKNGKIVAKEILEEIKKGRE